MARKKKSLKRTGTRILPASPGQAPINRFGTTRTGGSSHRKTKRKARK